VVDYVGYKGHHGDDLEDYCDKILLAYIGPSKMDHLDGRDFSAEMVKAGFAIDWPKFSGGRYRHLESLDARKRMWRADARQKGNWPPKDSGV
jgi:endonuclease YncB( thermonuclease family)